VLLSKRFDRQGQERIHFASAMNLLELKDGNKSSYAEIADVIQQVGERAEDSVELFRRMIFNLLINNVDDHLRNHGFLRGERGWFLSPAYDVNPMSRVLWAPQHATSIVDEQSASNIVAALEAASFFDLSKARAQEIVEHVREAVSGWRKVADCAKAPRREVADVEDAFLVE
jgi:serine/threonine-protein kinase HipA